MTSSILPKYTKNEEIMNAVTHGIGAGLSIAGLVVLVVFASMQSDAWKITASAIYGAYDNIIYCFNIIPQLIKNKSSIKTKYV